MCVNNNQSDHGYGGFKSANQRKGANTYLPKLRHLYLVIMIAYFSAIRVLAFSHVQCVPQPAAVNMNAGLMLQLGVRDQNHTLLSPTVT